MKKLIIIAALQACKPAVEEPSLPAPPPACHAACQVMKQFACPEAERTLSGMTCEQVCENAKPFVEPGCIARASDLYSLRRCNVRCEP